MANIQPNTPSGASVKRFALAGSAAAVLGLLVTYVDGWRKLIESLKSLHESIRGLPGLEGLKWWGTSLFVAAMLAVVALCVCLRKWRVTRLEEKRIEAERLLTETRSHRFFSVEPLPPPKGQVEPTRFHRADCKHEVIFDWIRSTTRPLIYVTGQSGTGKARSWMHT